jgi:hypothetical protein
MKITRNTTKTHTSWDYVGIGQTFVERPGGPVFLKTTEFFEQQMGDQYNAVNLETGELVGFITDCEVIIVKTELTVEE